MSRIKKHTTYSLCNVCIQCCWFLKATPCFFSQLPQQSHNHSPDGNPPQVVNALFFFLSSFPSFFSLVTFSVSLLFLFGFLVLMQLLWLRLVALALLCFDGYLWLKTRLTRYLNRQQNVKTRICRMLMFVWKI